MAIDSINTRYSQLAENNCCLSCGSAVSHAFPMPGEVCVDLGSGRGTDVIRMAEAVGDNGFVYGIDISEGMIRAATRNAEKFGLKNVRFIRADLENIDIPDESVDLVISNCTINHATNKQQVWNEIYRIMKQGGRFVVSDIYAVAPVAVEYKNDPDAIAECWAGAVTRDEYFEMLNNSGFKGLMVIEESKPYDKGKAIVSSITISGLKTSGKCCC